MHQNSPAISRAGSVVRGPWLAGLAISLLLLTGCSLRGGGGGSSAPLVGSAGTSLVQLTPRQGDVEARQDPFGSLDDSIVERITALTYDPRREIFYGLATSERSMELITFDGKKPSTVRNLGPILMPRVDKMVPWVAEAIVWNPHRGDLVVAASRLKHTPISSVLLRVDPKTARGEVLAEIEGTEQNEADALAFAGDDVLAIDNVVGRGQLYRLDLKTGQAKPLGKSFTPTVEALAFDARSGTLFGIAREAGQLVRLVPGEDGTPTVVPVADLAEDNAVHTLATLAGEGHAASPWPEEGETPVIFSDDFESGSTNTWSRREDGGG